MDRVAYINENVEFFAYFLGIPYTLKLDLFIWACPRILVKIMIYSAFSKLYYTRQDKVAEKVRDPTRKKFGHRTLQK